MNGQIFISYRREDAPHPAGRLHELLSTRFPQNRIFIDIDNIPLGVDFVEEIKKNVGACDVLIAIIGKQWLTISDNQGRRRLDDTKDFVRLEIATALKRNIRVIPVLVDGASMPEPDQLPKDLQPLAYRNALEVSYNRFRAEAERLIPVVEEVLESARVEQQRKREEQERDAAEQRQEKERLEAEQRAQAHRLELERQQEEQATSRAEQERLEAERRQREAQERLVAERQERERQQTVQQESEHRQQKKEERLEESRQKETLALEGKIAGPRASPSVEDGPKAPKTPVPQLLVNLKKRWRLLLVLASSVAVLVIGFGFSNRLSTAQRLAEAKQRLTEAKRYLDTKDYVKALPLLQEAAETGNAEAMYHLGGLYDNYGGAAQDYAQALKWYEKAAKGGNVEAMCRLGYLYENGRGIAQDYTQALKWYQKAAAAGSTEAMYNLGYLYQSGHGAAQDYAKAREWYEKAAAAGNAWANYALSQLPSK